MSFTQKDETSKIYAPGWFLADTQNYTAVTKQMKQDGGSGKPNTVVELPDGSKYVPMGSLYKENDKTIGIVYEDVDVTTGDMPGSVVISGIVYKDRIKNGETEETFKDNPKITVV